MLSNILKHSLGIFILISCSFQVLANDCLVRKVGFFIGDNLIVGKRYLIDECQKNIVKIEQESHYYYSLKEHILDKDFDYCEIDNFAAYTIAYYLQNLKNDLETNCDDESCTGIIAESFALCRKNNQIIADYINTSLDIKISIVNNNEDMKYKFKAIMPDHFEPESERKFALLDVNEYGFAVIKSLQDSDLYSTDIRADKFNSISYKTLDLKKNIVQKILMMIDEKQMRNFKFDVVYASGTIIDVLNKFLIDNQDFKMDRLSMQNLLTRLDGLNAMDMKINYNLDENDSFKFVSNLVYVYSLMKIFGFEKLEYVPGNIALEGYVVSG